MRTWHKKYLEIDPGCFNLVTALQVTLAGCLGALVWGLFKPPDPFLLFVQPALLIIFLNMLSVHRNGFFLLLMTVFNIAIGLVFCAMLYQTRWLFLLFIFVYTYLNFRTLAYRPIGALVVILGTLNAGPIGGGQYAINNVIVVFISLGLTLITYILAAPLRQNCLKRIIQQLTFHLAEMYMARGVHDRNATPVTSTKAVAQCAALALKLNVLVNKMWYILPAEQMLQLQARPMLHQVRMLMVDYSLLHNLTEHLHTLRQLVPSTDDILADISQRLFAAANGIFAENRYSPIRQETLYQQWLTEKDAGSSSGDSAWQSCRLILYALDCILEDLRNFEEAIVHLHDPISVIDADATPAHGLSKKLKTLLSKRNRTDQNPGIIDTLNTSYTARLQQRMQADNYCGALRVAIAATASVFIWKAAQLPHGYWILMTVIIIYCGVNQGNVLQRSGYRLLGTFGGILLTFLFVRNFLLFNVAWAYTLPLVFFLMIYLFLLTGRYTIMTLFITLFTGLLLSTMSGVRPDFFLYGTLFYRMFCTMIAAVIVLVAEWTIFPHVMQSSSALQRTWHSLIHDLSDGLPLIVQRYTRQTPFTASEWRSLTGMLEKYVSTEHLYTLMQYEISVPDQYEVLYKEHQMQIRKLLSAFGELIALASHEKPDRLTTDRIAQINQMAEDLSTAITQLDQQPASTARPQANTIPNTAIFSDIPPDLQPLLFVEGLTHLAHQLTTLQQSIQERATS